MNLDRYYKELNESLLRKCYQDIIEDLLRQEKLEHDLECAAEHTECRQSGFSLMENGFSAITHGGANKKSAAKEKTNYDLHTFSNETRGE